MTLQEAKEKRKREIYLFDTNGSKYFFARLDGTWIVYIGNQKVYDGTDFEKAVEIYNND